MITAIVLAAALTKISFNGCVMKPGKPTQDNSTATTQTIDPKTTDRVLSYAAKNGTTTVITITYK